MRGYTDVQERPVDWHGKTAVYSLAETEQLRGLPTREAWVIHSLKALCGGEVTTGIDVEATQKPQDGTKPEGGLTTSTGSEPSAESLTEPPSVYTDPEDIDFGPPAGSRKRTKRIFANVWTPRRHRRHKTKKRCLEQQRVWKRWYERQGWKVTNHASGYFAMSPGGERHAIVLHEYDAETRERL